MGSITFDDSIKSISIENNRNIDDIIIPGFVDLHCHGGNGFDTMKGSSSIQSMSIFHLKNGTTTLLPTTLTAKLEDTLVAMKGFNSLIKKNKSKTNILGVHLEGPFINPNKLGAQPSFAQLPNIDFINKIEEEAIIKVITLAPELEGSVKFVKYLITKKIKVQIGHSLANYETCMKIFKKNNIGFTHLYNAMSGNDHRNPGVLTAALKNAKYAEIICDLNHVNKANIYLAHKCIPKLYAVSDSISATGMPDGDYDFANIKITKKNNKALTKNNILAGSIVTMYDTFKNLVKINFPLNDAVAMTSYNAAQYLDEKNIGKIEKGYCSNFIVLDNKLNIKQVYLYGNLVK